MVVCLVAPLAAENCPGDCSGDLDVTVDELVTCVRAALSQASAGCPACDRDDDGRVDIAELLAAVGVAVDDVLVAANGRCFSPGPNGLEACAAGTEVGLSRCIDRSRCLGDPEAREPLDSASVDADGRFSLMSCNGARSALIFEAAVETGGGASYRRMDFGPLTGFGAGGGATGTFDLNEVDVGPQSEAAIRLVDEAGLQNFSDGGVLEIIDTVERQTAQIDYAELDAQAAADVATQAAREDAQVQQVIESNRFTPTPTPTATPTPTRAAADVNVTSEGTVRASSVFGADQYPASLAVDGDRRTSWFSDGSAGGPTETYRWDGARDDRIVSIAVLSNAQHPQFPGFGFQSLRIEVLDASGAVVFSATRSLPGSTDPDVAVSPDIVGRSVLLTFDGHDDPACGGFSELQVVARR